MKYNLNRAAGLFKYAYGFSSVEKQEFLESILDLKARRSTSEFWTAREAYTQIEHFRRYHASGRFQASFADSLYTGENPILSRVKNCISFSSGAFIKLNYD